MRFFLPKGDKVLAGMDYGELAVIVAALLTRVWSRLPPHFWFLMFACCHVHRFEAYGWHTQVVTDGTNTSVLMEAIENAKKETGRPSIIKTKTIIGHGSQRQVRQRMRHMDT